MLDLSTAARLEKNRLESDGAVVMLLEIFVSDDQVIRVCRNTDDVVWGGRTWTAFPFEVDEAATTGYGDLPKFGVRVSNISGVVQAYVEEASGGVGSRVKMYVVLARNDGTVMADPFFEGEFSVGDVNFDADWVTFNLTGSVNLIARIPQRRFLKNSCPFQYKGPECRSTSSYTSCDKTLASCRKRGNGLRFGGEPGIPLGGMYLK